MVDVRGENGQLLCLCRGSDVDVMEIVERLSLAFEFGNDIRGSDRDRTAHVDNLESCDQPFEASNDVGRRLVVTVPVVESKAQFGDGNAADRMPTFVVEPFDTVGDIATVDIDENGRITEFRRRPDRESRCSSVQCRL